MLSTLITLLGGSLGALARYIPEIFKMFQDKTDKAHEIQLTQLQLQLEQQKAAAASQQQVQLSQSQEILANMDALKSAIEGQDKLTGVSWIDGLNKLVRPTITYWWLLLFTLYKILTIYIVIQNGAPLQQIVEQIWQERDAGIMSMIITFWFVDRAIRRNNGDLS